MSDLSNNRRLSKFTYSFAIALSLAMVLGSGSASAGWLDKLKEKLGGNETLSETLSSDDIGAGRKEALRVGTETVVGQLGQTDGFNLDPQVRILLPDQLDKAKNVLSSRRSWARRWVSSSAPSRHTLLAKQAIRNQRSTRVQSR